MRRIVSIALAAAALAASQSAIAQQAPVARLVGISGNVLVSTEANIASAGENLRLAPGMRVIVTLNSAAVVEYTDGCRVRLAAGDRLDVQAGRPCAARASQVGGAYVPVLAGRP